MKKYQYVLLDWDGNLAKTLDVWLQACRIPFQARGLNLTESEIGSTIGDLSGSLKERGIKDIRLTIDEINEQVEKLIPEAELYPNALEILDKLKGLGKQIALITTSYRRHVINLLTKYDMAHYFDVVIAYEDTKEHKPHPQPLEKGLSELGGNKSETIMIGDSKSDIGAANNAGIDSILFFPPEHKRFYNFDELKKLNPTYIVDDFRQVLKIV